MVGPFLIDSNPVELKYYTSRISLDKYSGNCNSGDDLSAEIFFLSKTKYVNVEVFNMIRNRNVARTLVRHFVLL